MKFNAVYKKDLTGNIRYRQVEVDGDKYRTYSGIVGREATSEQVTEWTYAEATNIGRANEMSAEQQALRLKNRIYQIAREQGYYDTVEEAGKGTGYFQPMLAQKWYGMPEKKRIDMFYIGHGQAYMQPKLDGCLSADTKVLTDEGEFTIQDVIENGKGNTILSYNTKTKEVEQKQILGRFKNGKDLREENPQWFKITLQNGETITVTGNHRVYLPKLGCWRRVDEIQPGDEFLEAPSSL